MQRDFARRIPDSQDPLDTRGCRRTFPGGSQTVRILRTPIVPGGSEGLSQEDPRHSGSSGHWCQGVQRDFTRKIPDSQDPPDTGARGCRGTSPGGSQTVRILRTLVPEGAEGHHQEDPRQSGSSGHWCQGVQRDITKRIPDSQDPPDTGARGCRGTSPGGSPPDTGARGCRGTSPGGSQTVRILRTLVPGGAEGHHQEDPRQSESSGHWCQGVQRDITRRIPDSQDPPDTGARGCRGTSPGGSQTVRILRTLVPGGAEGHRQEDPRQPPFCLPPPPPPVPPSPHPPPPPPPSPPSPPPPPVPPSPPNPASCRDYCRQPRTSLPLPGTQSAQSQKKLTV